MKKIYLWLLTCLLASSLIAQDFEEITEAPFDSVYASSIAFADVDNDGDQDVLITGVIGYGRNSQVIAKLYTNDGNGNFEEVIGTPFEGVCYSSIAFADVDSDGDQDVLFSGKSYSAGFSKLYTNDGNGNFTEVLDTPFELVFGNGDIAFADVDNDNDQDVLITGLTSTDPSYFSISKLYTNDGNGIYIEVTETPFEGVYSSSIAFADVDNDNDQDLLITGNGSGFGVQIAKLYTNDGNGNFTEVLDTPFEEVSRGSIAFTDIDNDGDQDVLITGSNEDVEGPIAKLYTNDGNGIFTEVLETPFEGIYLSSIAFADVDNDNDQDVLITGGNPYDRIAKLYTNDGNGNFTEVFDTPFEGVSGGSIAFADVDSDGDQDVLITGLVLLYEYAQLGDSKLYRNLSPVGINENALFSNVSIFPNPNKGLINIDLGSLTDVSIKVLNLSGRLIYYKENINTPIYQFELDAAPGIYILELSAGVEKQQFKLVEQ